MLSSSYLIHTLFEFERYQNLHLLIDSGFWTAHKSLFSYFGSSETVDDEAFWYQGYDEQFASLPRKILVVPVQKNMR